MTLEVAFGKVLAEQRAISQFTQADLALRAGIAASFVSRLERGQTSPTIETIFRIANAFEMQPEDLVKRLRHNADENAEVLSLRSKSKGVTRLKRTPDARNLLATNARQLRRKAGITQKELADLAGIHPTYVSQVERCIINATTDVIQQLADTLSVPVARLFEVPSTD